MHSQSNTPNISVCLIVKNEEQYLRECLESIKPIADQIVVLDTGSKDSTIQIAEESGAEVYTFDWCNDFSAARNESIKYAKCEWILWIDADERLLPESIPELKKLLVVEKKPVIYKINIKNLTNHDAEYSLSSAHRLFTNNRGIFFSGRIHEQISPSASKVNATERHSNVFLHHIGYSFDKDKTNQKFQRNLKLLIRAVNDLPNSGYAHYTLGQQYSLLENPQKALKHFRISYRLNQFDKSMTASLLNTMSESLVKLQRYSEAQSYAKKSIQLKPLQAGGYYLLYKISEHNENNEDSKDWLIQLLDNSRKLNSGIKTISTDVIIDEGKILYTIGTVYKKMSNSQEAIKNYEKALRFKKDNTKIQNALIELCIETENYSKAERYLIESLQVEPDMQRLNVLGNVLIKQQKFTDAISVYETMFQLNPEDLNIAKRLIGLWGKIGDLGKANALMSRLSI